MHTSAPPITALIIDDEQLAREELKYLLDSAGSVEVVAQGANGIEAVELIREYQPDLVFLDVQMPGLDGFAVLKQLIEHKDRLPQIIFATAFDQYAVRAFDVNAIDYLLKPFDKARVLQAVERARLRLQETAQPEGDSLAGPGGFKLDSLIRLIEQQQQNPRVHSGKIVLQAQSRLLLIDQKDICFASIDEGIISVATQTIEGQSTMPHSRRTARAARSHRLLARAPLLCGQHQPHQGSGPLVQVQLPAPHGRQEADGNPRQPRPDQAPPRALQALAGGTIRLPRSKCRVPHLRAAKVGKRQLDQR